MTPQELKARFDALASKLWAARTELIELSEHLSRPDDKKASQSIATDLTWATENCSVIGSHQIGRALTDNMGTGESSC
jgi:hypothetical protein